MTYLKGQRPRYGTDAVPTEHRRTQAVQLVNNHTVVQILSVSMKKGGSSRSIATASHALIPVGTRDERGHNGTLLGSCWRA
jgi:hypothetical protein